MYLTYIDYLCIIPIISNRKAITLFTHTKGGIPMDKRYMALATSMLVLKLLDKKSMYGYQIIRELEQQSQNVFQLQEGTLYPVLHSLEQQGAVRASQQLADNGRVRKYYTITSPGQKLLQEKAREWKVYETAVNLVMGGVLFE